jgi:hypothetical protein
MIFPARKKKPRNRILFVGVKNLFLKKGLIRRLPSHVKKVIPEMVSSA